jgi:hypothetical protein
MDIRFRKGVIDAPPVDQRSVDESVCASFLRVGGGGRGGGVRRGGGDGGAASTRVARAWRARAVVSLTIFWLIFCMPGGAKGGLRRKNTPEKQKKTATKPQGQEGKGRQ